MLDAAQALTRPRPVRFERASGAAQVALTADGALTRLRRLSQSGSAKAFLPDVHRDPPEIVFLNTAGGLTGGDRLSFAVDLGPGAAAVAATQTAERAYRAAGGMARLDVRLGLGAGARLDWLPQETILFDGAALSRSTRADLDRGARLLMAESLILGRAAMGERVGRVSLTDRREVWRAGAPMVIDAFRLSDAALAPRPALLGPDRAIATLWLIEEGAEDAVGPLRAALGPGAAVSGWDGRCCARLSAPDGLTLRRRVVAALAVLRRGAPLPRVWQG
ncbi:MAG: urease accessory protein UreD [Paracoccaceae bacterium]